MHVIADIAFALIASFGFLGGSYLGALLAVLIAASGMAAIFAHGLRIDGLDRAILCGLSIASLIGAMWFVPSWSRYGFGLGQAFLAAFMVRRFLVPAIASLRAR